MKKVNPIERAKEVVLALNAVKIKNPQLSTEHLKSLLQSNGCPYSHYIPPILEKRGFITRKKGICTFTHTEPIHYASIINDLNEVANNCKAKNKIVKNIERFPTNWKEADAELMVEYLKTQDYVIFKKTLIEC